MNATPTIPTLPKASFASRRTEPENIGPAKSVLLYGDTGTRKTTMFGELVRDGFYNRALWFDFDNGSEALSTDDDIKACLADGRIELYAINPFAPDAKQEIENNILEAAGMWRDPKGNILPNPNIPDFGYDLLLIDTVNLMGEVGIKWFLANTYNDKGQLDGRKAYGLFAVWMDEMIRLIHNSKRFAGGFIMHAMSDEEATGAIKVKPKMQGGFRNSIASIPSITAYLDFEKSPETGENVLVATVGESDIFEAKNRYRLAPKLYDFNLSKLYDTIPNTKTARIAAPALVAATPAAVAA